MPASAKVDETALASAPSGVSWTTYLRVGHCLATAATDLSFDASTNTSVISAWFTSYCTMFSPSVS